MKDPWIAPSILSADFARLGAEVEAASRAGADMIHFDVMDMHYVPNLTIGPLVLRSLKRHGITLPVDVHLMVSPVDELIRLFADAGADYITFHPEATRHVHRSLSLARELGVKCGLVLNPGTPSHCLDPVLHLLDMVLVMSVNPGFPAQAFLSSSLKTLSEVRTKIDAARFDIRLEIDGGIGPTTIASARDAGADTFVAGSAIFGAPDYQAAIDAMRHALA
ncbi:MAG: ribulose-phosphate 3-epimerase [Gammaproteobacteria bacterium]|nr:ribulose-phosphate 3-epimerase [Gammaproteobacteria bacterium]MCY4323046.1 ribulose-phosphate 3-epimerase [Gammaproteobacteria bacterium]